MDPKFDVYLDPVNKLVRDNNSLILLRYGSTTPTQTPSMSKTPSLTPSLSISATRTPTPTPTPTVTITPSRTPTPSPTLINVSYRYIGDDTGGNAGNKISSNLRLVFGGTFTKTTVNWGVSTDSTSNGTTSTLDNSVHAYRSIAKVGGALAHYLWDVNCIIKHNGSIILNETHSYGGSSIPTTPTTLDDDFQSGTFTSNYGDTIEVIWTDNVS